MSVSVADKRNRFGRYENIEIIFVIRRRVARKMTTFFDDNLFDGLIIRQRSRQSDGSARSVENSEICFCNRRVCRQNLFFAVYRNFNFGVPIEFSRLCETDSLRSRGIIVYGKSEKQSLRHLSRGITECLDLCFGCGCDGISRFFIKQSLADVIENGLLGSSVNFQIIGCFRRFGRRKFASFFDDYLCYCRIISRFEMNTYGSACPSPKIKICFGCRVTIRKRFFFSADRDFYFTRPIERCNLSRVYFLRSGRIIVSRQREKQSVFRCAAGIAESGHSRVLVSFRNLPVCNGFFSV